MKTLFRPVSIMVIGAVSAAFSSGVHAQQNKFWGPTSSTAPVYAPGTVQQAAVQPAVVQQAAVQQAQAVAAPITIPAVNGGSFAANTINIPAISSGTSSTTTSTNTINNQFNNNSNLNLSNANMASQANTFVQNGGTSVETIYSPNYIPQQQQRFIAQQPVAYAAPQPVPTATGQSVQYFVGYKQKTVPQVQMRTVQVPVQKTRMVSVKRTIMVPKEITEQKMVPYQAFESREQQVVVPKTVQVPQYYRANYYTKVYRGPIQSVETLPAEIQANAGTYSSVDAASFGGAAYGNTATYSETIQQNSFAAPSAQFIGQGQNFSQGTPLPVNFGSVIGQ